MRANLNHLGPLSIRELKRLELLSKQNADHEDHSNTKTNQTYTRLLQMRPSSRKMSSDSEGSGDDLMPRATPHKIPT